MALSKDIQREDGRHVRLNGRDVDYRVVRSKTASRLRIRVSMDGVSVILPRARGEEEAHSFLQGKGTWVTEQIDRIRRMSKVRTPSKSLHGEVLLRGEKLPIRIVRNSTWRGPSRISLETKHLVITCGNKTQTPFAFSLENWLRRQARESVEKHVADVVRKVKRVPNRIYIMDQRTKWGNCSALGNLSFNWRLIMAPEFVLQYIVTHEVVHLAVPDHSQRFWLTVQSMCPLAEKARQWLAANGQKLTQDLDKLF